MIFFPDNKKCEYEIENIEDIYEVKEYDFRNY